MDKVATILGALACPNNADDVFGLEVDVTEFEENGRGIRTIKKASGVSLLAIN